MKILIDINHPAHVHYFRNFISHCYKSGHKVFIVAREKKIIHYLLDYYQIPFISRGSGSNTKIGKLFYMLKADIKLLGYSIKKKPDIFISFSSPYAAQVAKILGKPHIAINDTEHTDKIHRKFTYPFSDVILTPFCYQNDLGNKQYRLTSVIEYLYLHPDYYSFDKSIYEKYNINKKYIVIRFVAWNAHHDFGQKGLDIETTLKIINLAKDSYSVFISAEGELDGLLEQYQIKIKPEDMHHILRETHLFIGESATMASEAALLGTHAVYVNSLPLMGYLHFCMKHGLLDHFVNNNNLLKRIEDLLSDKELKKKSSKLRNLMVKDYTNPTKFLIWFIEHYPHSKYILKTHKEHINNLN